MKCDHIRTKRQGDTPFFPNMLNNGNVEVCLKEDVDEVIAELKTELEERKNAAIDIKLSSEKVLRDLLDCGLINEWYFNGKFNVVLNVDDPHLKIAELKQKLHDAEMAKDDAEAANTEYRLDIEKLKTENERTKLTKEKAFKCAGKAINTIANVELELRATQRALWIARAERALSNALIFYFAESDYFILNIQGYAQKKDGASRMLNAKKWYKIWKKVERLCRAKAEEYK